MLGVTKRLNQYEAKQKAKLVELGQSDKPYRDILSYLKAEIETSTRMTNFRHHISCFKNDGVYQLNKAIEEIYGSAQAKTDSQPSGGMDNIETVDVTLADGSRIKVPYGKIDLPDLGEDAHIDIGYDESANTLYIKGTTQYRWSSTIDEIVDRTKVLLNTESVYKDQAIELDDKFQPKIMPLTNIDKEFMVMSKRMKYELQPLMSRILHPQKCKDNGITLKYGALFEGTYGTGKTLLAFKIAKQAIDNGWCFIYLKDPKLLARTLKLSKTLDNNGYGIIVFLEDVDQVTKGKRDEAMQDILNTLDGGDTKQMNVISLFTTNHIENINPTFLRGERIGSVISMGSFDAETAKEYLEYTFKDSYTLDTEGLTQVCQNIADVNIVPAFLSEICKTVKSNMLFQDNETVIKAEYIQASLDSYQRQVALANKKDVGESDAEVYYRASQKLLASTKDIQEIKTAVV
jgi:hypothetical protein